jgi:hypothetical protein
MLVDAERPGRVHVPSMVFLTVCVFFSSRIHPERCTKYIEERARKPEPQVSPPTGGGSSPTKRKPNLHPSMKKEKAQEIQRTPSRKA